MGRMYTVEFENRVVANADGDHDLFEITPADDKPCTVHAIYLSQSTEVGDGEEEMLRLQIIRGHTTSGDNGVSPAPTPRPSDPGDAAAGFTAEAENTTIASGGTTENLHSESFNVRTGWVYLPTPEMRPKVTQAETTLVLRLLAAPADDVTMNGTIYIEEG